MQDWIEGRRVLVTGGSSGIGFETAKALARQGAELIIASRDLARTEAAAARISAETGRKVSALQVDLSSQTAIRAFAQEFTARHSRLDVLVNNAGAIFSPRQTSADGIEMTWALNHLGPFLLTAELLNVLQAAPEGRVVTVASAAHMQAKIHFDDPEFKTAAYRSFAVYSQSKLANIMFTFALARRLEGSHVMANCLHPGVVASGFFRGVPVVGGLFSVLGRPFLLSEAKGARTSVYVAGSADLSGQSGGYYANSALVQASAASRDVAAQEKLWALSVAQTGADWPF